MITCLIQPATLSRRERIFTALVHVNVKEKLDLFMLKVKWVEEREKERERECCPPLLRVGFKIGSPRVCDIITTKPFFCAAPKKKKKKIENISNKRKKNKKRK